jgi:hypothetical protein
MDRNHCPLTPFGELPANTAFVTKVSSGLSQQRKIVDTQLTVDLMMDVYTELDPQRIASSLLREMQTTFLP